MKFKTQTSDLSAALSVASVVRPIPVDSQGSAGYLFRIQGERCYVYSEDDRQKSRVDFPIFDVEGEGAFVYPTGHTNTFQYLDGWVEFEPKSEAGVFLIEYRTEGGASSKMSSFDPKALQSLDKDLDSATEGPTFPVALLKEAVSLGKKYLAEANDGQAKEYFKAFQIFDDSKESWAKGNGHFFAANGYRAFYFYSPDFEERGLCIHTLRVGLLESFLSKSEGEIRIRKSERATYLVNSKNQVIGWADQVVEHEKFNYYALTKDTFILRIPKEVASKALLAVRTELDSKRDRVRVQYNHERGTLQFHTSDGANEFSSIPVGVVPLDSSDGTEEAPIIGGDQSKKADFTFNVNINYFMDLISPVKAHEVELRVGPVNETSYLIRTIEEFYLDSKGKVLISPEEGEKAHKCRVTRFMSNKK